MEFAGAVYHLLDRAPGGEDPNLARRCMAATAMPAHAVAKLFGKRSTKVKNEAASQFHGIEALSRRETEGGRSRP